MASINPKNVTAQFSYRASGNPPSTLPQDAISNFYPGLEFDLRSLWKHILSGIELHETGLVTDGHQVLAVTPGSPADVAGVRPGFRLLSVDARPVEASGMSDQGPMPERFAMEFFNSLADVVQKAGQPVRCVFQDSGSGTVVPGVTRRPRTRKNPPPPITTITTLAAAISHGRVQKIEPRAGVWPASFWMRRSRRAWSCSLNCPWRARIASSSCWNGASVSCSSRSWAR